MKAKAPKSKKPKVKTPPEESQLAAGIVATPGLTGAIQDLVAAVDRHSAALDRNSEKIDDQVEATKANTAATLRLSQTVDDHAETIEEHGSAIEALTVATLKLVEIFGGTTGTGKATRITLTVEPELITEPPNTPEVPNMPPTQIHTNEGFAATLLMNGPIDGEPTVTCEGPVTEITVDPKIEEPVPGSTDPNARQTRCVVHGVCTDPTQITGGEKVSLHAECLVDNPATEELEKIAQDFPECVEWLPPSQPKATAITISVVSEPLS